MAPPVNLSVSLRNPTIKLAGGASVSVPVVIMAPTETVTFTINGLPAGVSQSYKESESNPSGQLTLMASPVTNPGTYQPVIVVGSSGRMASTVFTLVITSMSAGVFLPRADAICSSILRMSCLGDEVCKSIVCVPRTDPRLLCVGSGAGTGSLARIEFIGANSDWRCKPG